MVSDAVESAQPKPSPSEDSTALFRTEWQTYRKMVDNNYLFHMEAYRRLEQALRDRFDKSFRFLDIACGDAAETAKVLKDTHVAHYYGIDLSPQALELAAERLGGLQCPIELHEGDFADILSAWRSAVDIAWISLGLHHLRTPAKLEAMHQIRRIVNEGGELLIYENATLEGEDREGWLVRWDEQALIWSAYSAAEWERVTAHVHAADFPEAPSIWLELGRRAGFSASSEIFVSPTKLFSMYLYRA